MKTTFCLRDTKRRGPSPIHCFVHWTTPAGSYQWKLATGSAIEPRLWETKRRRAKKGARMKGQSIRAWVPWKAISKGHSRNSMHSPAQ